MRVAVRKHGVVGILPAMLLQVAVGALASCDAAEPSANSPGDGSTDDAASTDSCRPQLPAGWAPTWKPPRAPILNACSETQIRNQYSLCEDDVTYDAVTCKAFQRDPANGACRRCLYSTQDESVYGAIVIQRDRSEVANIGGCIAVVEGDANPAGCGAKFQAVSACFDAACTDVCPSNASFLQCRQVARNGFCAAYADDDSCANRPAYSSCAQFTSFQEYFMAMARLFCSTGMIGGEGRDAARAEGRWGADLGRARSVAEQRVQLGDDFAASRDEREGAAE